MTTAEIPGGMIDEMTDDGMTGIGETTIARGMADASRLRSGILTGTDTTETELETRDRQIVRPRTTLSHRGYGRDSRQVRPYI